MTTRQSRPRQPDSFAVEKIIAGVGALTGAPVTEEQHLAAQHFACTQLELAQIQAIRAQQWDKTDLIEDLPVSTKDLRGIGIVRSIRALRTNQASQGS
jgi:hypothetical protein